MYIYEPKVTVRHPDSNITHILMVNPENKKDAMTACGLIVQSDWLRTLRSPSCEECNA